MLLGERVGVRGNAANSFIGRDVVPNVPDLFGAVGARAGGANAAQGQLQLGDSLFARLEEKGLGTMGTAFLPGFG